jgi:VLRF1 release factor-like protein
VDVPPARLTRWFENFGTRHGDVSTAVVDGVLTVRAADGSLAECHAAPGVRSTTDFAGFVTAAAEPLRIGLVLARKASVAVGVAVGDDLIVHKVDTAYVQSRTAAGGWSQHRFARRRDNQAKAAAGDASELVLRLLVPEAPKLVTIVTGGDRRTIESIMGDQRLSRLMPKIAERFLDVAEPRFGVLQDAVNAARAVRIKVTDPVM